MVRLVADWVRPTVGEKPIEDGAQQSHAGANDEYGVDAEKERGGHGKNSYIFQSNEGIQGPI